MKELNIKPASMAVPEGFFEQQRRQLLAIPLKEQVKSARRKRLWLAGGITAAAALIAAFFTPAGFGGKFSVEQNMDNYIAHLSDNSLNQAVELADWDPYYEIEHTNY